AHAAGAHVGLGARVAVVTRRGIRLVGETARSIAVAGAAALVALVGRSTGVRCAAADAGGAHVGLGAGDAVVADGAVRLVGEAARPVAIAGARLVALVGRRAAVSGAAARAGGAHVGLGAGVAV